jgi:hypothetical protein
MSKKIAPVSVRLTIEDKGRIAQSAAAEGISMSEYLRRGALGSVKVDSGEEPDKPGPGGSDKRKRRR